jgi:hypothetical protein
MRTLLILALATALLASTAAHYFTVLLVPPSGGREGQTFILDREAPLSWIETPATVCARALAFTDRSTCERAVADAALSRSKTVALPWIPGLSSLAPSPSAPDSDILRRLNR